MYFRSYMLKLDILQSVPFQNFITIYEHRGQVLCKEKLRCMKKSVSQYRTFKILELSVRKRNSQDSTMRPLAEVIRVLQERF